MLCVGTSEMSERVEVKVEIIWCGEKNMTAVEEIFWHRTSSGKREGIRLDFRKLFFPGNNECFRKNRPPVRGKKVFHKRLIKKATEDGEVCTKRKKKMV